MNDLRFLSDYVSAREIWIEGILQWSPLIVGGFPLSEARSPLPFETQPHVANQPTLGWAQPRSKQKTNWLVDYYQPDHTAYMYSERVRKIAKKFSSGCQRPTWLETLRQGSVGSVSCPLKSTDERCWFGILSSSSSSSWSLYSIPFF